MQIEILYFEGCPNHVPTVELVKRIVADLGVTADIEEIELMSPEDVERLRFLGSPTVLVDGIDIDPDARNRTDYSYSCRVYGGMSGLPPEVMLIDALQQ